MRPHHGFIITHIKFFISKKQIPKLIQKRKDTLDTLKSHLRIKKSEVWIKNFSEMAQIETMRRIAIIFELNFKGDKKWNKMLPLLINNFHEAQELFN